jgi:hypothetical protein
LENDLAQGVLQVAVLIELHAPRSEVEDFPKTEELLVGVHVGGLEQIRDQVVLERLLILAGGVWQHHQQAHLFLHAQGVDLAPLKRAHPLGGLTHVLFDLGAPSNQLLSAHLVLQFLFEVKSDLVEHSFTQSGDLVD